MKITKFAPAFAIAAALAATPALSQDQVAAGATVYGPEGAEVGTIVSVANGQAVLDTGTNQVPLPLDTFGEGEDGPRVSVTKIQLDTMVEQQMAQANAARDAALIDGAAIVTADGQELGTVVSVTGDDVLVARAGADAREFNLPRDYFAMNGSALTARLTMAQVDAALAGAAAE